MSNARAIHWFRKGLRLHDNPALLAAGQDAQVLFPVYIFDPATIQNGAIGLRRWHFLLQTLQDLDESLRKLNSRLFVFVGSLIELLISFLTFSHCDTHYLCEYFHRYIAGSPHEVLPQLFKIWRINKLTFENDSEPWALQRDVAIQKMASEMGIHASGYTGYGAS